MYGWLSEELGSDKDGFVYDRCSLRAPSATSAIKPCVGGLIAPAPLKPTHNRWSPQTIICGTTGLSPTRVKGQKALSKTAK